MLGMVQARLDAIGPEAKRALRGASVFGATFWGGGLSVVLGGDGPPKSRRDTGGASLAVVLDDLCAREVIVRRAEARFPDEHEYTFRNTLVREAAYAMLAEHDRSIAHRLAGAWLERVPLPDDNVLRAWRVRD